LFPTFFSPELRRPPEIIVGMTPTEIQARRASSALAHQCHACRKHWALQVVDHPSGKVILCRYCKAVRASIPASSSGARYSILRATS
jgi:hypothetical protein